MTIHLKLQQKPTPTWTDAHLVSSVYTPPYIVANSPATFRFLYTNAAGDAVVSASGITNILCEVWSSQAMKTGGQDGILIAPAAVSVTTAAPLIADWNAATGSYYTATVTMTATETAAAITVMDDDASGLQGWMEVRGTLGGQNVLLGSGPLMVHKGSTGGTPPAGPDTYYTTAEADAEFTKLAFKTIAVSGQSDIVADALDDTLTIVAGTNITLTTSGDTLTITSAGGGGGGGSGDVVGPSSAVNNRVVFFDGTTGKLIKDSGITLSGSNTGDQTSIAGITGTTAQFNTALSDGNFATLAGSEALTNKTVNGLTVTTSTGTLTIASGVTLTASNNITLATDGTGTRSLNIGAGGTLGTAAFTAATAYAAVSGSLGQFVAAGTTSTELRGVISDETGTGALVFAGGNIGAATATSLAATGNITTSAGTIECGTAGTASGSVVLYPAGNGSASTLIHAPNATDDRILSCPDGNGTLATQEYVGSWAGSTNITTLGTVATGTWSGTTIAVAKGGTGLTALGSALQVLRTNAGATAMEWATLSGGGNAQTADPLSQFAATTSAQLAGVISDETGSGALVFGTSPVFFGTPVLGDDTAAGLLQISGDPIAPGNYLAVSFPGSTGAQTWAFPDSSGTGATQEWVGTWTGSTNIASVGTVTTGTWSATTIGVAYGGTGRTSHTAYAVLCGGTTSTAAQQSIASVGTAGQVLKSAGAGALPTFEGETFTLGVACSDETTEITNSPTQKVAFDMPFDCVLTRIYATLTTAPTVSALTLDVEDEGVSLLNAVLSIATTNNNAETSTFAAAASTYTLTKGDLVTVDVDSVGSSNAGLKVFLCGRRTSTTP